LAVVLAGGAISSCATAGGSASLPEGFVFLADVAPGIVQDLRYAGTQNFTGTKVDGYQSGECVLTTGAASALARVQEDLRQRGFSLKVYDCYRPARATAAFMAWARSPSDSAARTSRYHPTVPRQRLVSAGYIASASSHSTGMAVDLTLIATPANPAAVAVDSRCGAPPDGTVDMGTGFDCFDLSSHVEAGGTTSLQRDARRMLADAMRRRGFRSYAREWWHFTFAAAAGGPIRDFVVPTRPKT
jgi:D-alanyl-D-alanine dipeptidase